MATKTRSDLVYQALTNLGVLAAGQTPSTEDYDCVDEHVEQVMGELDAKDVLYVDDLAAIPVEWMGPLAIILADDAAMDFGLPGVPASTPNPVQEAEHRLRLMTRGRPTGQALKVDYF